MKIKIKAPTAEGLIKLIQEHLPLPVRGTPEMCRFLEENGLSITEDQELRVSDVLNSGEVGGIMCTIADGDQPVAVSLTHLRIRPGHPLQSRIEAYQRDRVRKLARQRW
jgi:hypothetical protein